MFTSLFTGRCPSFADPTLCASIFNYSEKMPFNFYELCPNLHSFLNNHELNAHAESMKDNDNFNLGDFSNHSDDALPKTLCDVCEQHNIDFNIATCHMQNGSFQNLCKQIYCNQSVIVGKHMVEDLEISPCEFCQMTNHDAKTCEHHWAHCVKVSTLDEFVKCLKSRSEKNVNRLTQRLQALVNFK